ncbi:hypothetical protein HAX54_014310 [Datura stramonium]|uniref:Uncharacterized protein n=1 Tax=Datura stramonium TaxID=4076 RepID=A0ABS8Y273_DATST|nr:hypothetical protein [Datura stramonium]
MKVGPSEEPKNIPTQHPKGEWEGQSEFRLEGHGQEGGWQMGDPEESPEYDFSNSSTDPRHTLQLLMIHMCHLRIHLRLPPYTAAVAIRVPYEVDQRVRESFIAMTEEDYGDEKVDLQMLTIRDVDPREVLQNWTARQSLFQHES